MKILIYLFGIIPALTNWLISGIFFLIFSLTNIVYFKNLAITHDQNSNAYPNGDPDETPSSRMGKKVHKGGWRVKLCKALSFVLREENHCVESIEKDEGK